ncbi:hypothetical protein QTP70_001447 [Hemibagrus guttatus]|uniref:ribonuclease H n=1 Tax=Hemibagrus guttatus TaxID=175788 RepID=A0AAE0QMK3_9TELE|nr:hypothetical protein QTP70_001447 [Hemibagrus guttatus]KAK3557787.1 hypothetical protein QTP86_000743 [Hemibagrus guttatus]
MEIVKSTKFLSVHLAEDLTWSLNTSSITKKAQQRLYFLPGLRKAHLPPLILTTFYRGTIESILSSCITAWFGNCTASDRKTLQWIVRTAEKIIGVSLCSITDMYTIHCIRKAKSIVDDPTHPSHTLFTLLSSGKRYRSIQVDVFLSTLGLMQLVQHEIKTPPWMVVCQQLYRVLEAHHQAMEEERPNQISEFCSHPLPRVDDLVEWLGKAWFVSTLDITKAFWQVALAPDSKPKTVFTTSGGHWQYRVLPFGLHRAPAMFQRLMDIVLRPYRTFATAYLDDVLIHSPT